MNLKIKTTRLDIRPLTVKDFVAWKQAHLGKQKPKNNWDSDPKTKTELNKKKFSIHIKSLGQVRKSDLTYAFAVFNPSGEMMGEVSLMDVSRGKFQSAYLGYYIFNPHWGQGLAKEAVAAVIKLGFKELHLHRIEAGIEPGNKRSLALAKSLKMRREGVKRKALWIKKKWVDIVMYTLTCEDLGLTYRM